MGRCSDVVVTGRKRLLLIEDSAAQGGQLKATLEEFGFDVQWVDSGSAGLQAALEMPPDLVLLDVVMEDVDGFAVCRVLKQHDETCDIPIIMLTVRGDVEDRVVGLEIGADDYLAKPYAEAELRARIAVALRAKDARRELLRRTQQLESKLQHVQALATTDALTGLYNRRRFSEALDHECAVTKRYKSALSFLMLDLDHFKRINDTHGHEAGDEVLRMVSELLRQSLREVDLPARIGGDELAILLPQTPKYRAETVAQRIRVGVERSPVEYRGRRIPVTVSFGVADDSDVEAGNGEALMRAADKALYRAKLGGRNRVVVYDDA
jgi:two-component system cell cycle response regulator